MSLKCDCGSNPSTYAGDKYWVYCYNCGLRGPKRANIEQAEEEWNEMISEARILNINIGSDVVEDLFHALHEAKMNAEILMSQHSNRNAGPDDFDKEKDCLFMMYVKERNKINELLEVIGKVREI